jgi:hypothetical protein
MKVLQFSPIFMHGFHLLILSFLSVLKQPISDFPQKDNEKNIQYIILVLSTLSCLLNFVLFFNQPIADYLGYHNNPEYIKWFAWIAFFDNFW